VSAVVDFRFGFRVVGDCRQPRRLADWPRAFRAHAACDPRAECDKESYLSAFCFDRDFAAHLERTGTTRGYAGPCWAPWLWLDVDDPDLRQAVDAARRLASAATYGLGCGESDLLIFFSGSKGFHVGLPSAVWQPAPGRDFHRIARGFAEALAELAGVTIDTSVYDKVRCFRAPNSRHPKTGLHKRRLSVDELMHLGIDAILRLAGQPADFEVPAPTYRSEPAAALWAEATADVRQQAEAPHNGERQQLNRLTVDFIKHGAPVGNRHRLLYSAAANLAEMDAPLSLCFALLTEAALDCGLTPTDTRRAIENGWRRGTGEAIEESAAAEPTPTEGQA